MKALWALIQLFINFMKTALISGWDTARIILFKSQKTRSGLVYFHYEELSPNTAVILAALVTLTPGTTVIAINTDSKQLLLHLLDLDAKTKILRSIKQDFLHPLAVFNGRKP